MHCTRLTNDKWWGEEKNKFSRYSSSSGEIKLNKHVCDEREENLNFSEKEKPKQQYWNISSMTGAALSLLVYFSRNVRRVENFLFSAPEMFSFSPSLSLHFHFPRVFHRLLLFPNFLRTLYESKFFLVTFSSTFFSEVALKCRKYPWAEAFKIVQVIKVNILRSSCPNLTY